MGSNPRQRSCRVEKEYPYDEAILLLKVKWSAVGEAWIILTLLATNDPQGQILSAIEVHRSRGLPVALSSGVSPQWARRRDPFPHLTEPSVDEAQLLDEAEITPQLVPSPSARPRMDRHANASFVGPCSVDNYYCVSNQGDSHIRVHAPLQRFPCERCRGRRSAELSARDPWGRSGKQRKRLCQSCRNPRR